MSLTAKELASQISVLTGRPVTGKVCQAGALDKGVFGVFDSAEGEPKMVVVADVGFAAYSSAALSLLPKTVAEEAVRAQNLPENLAENFQEVVNVLGGTLNSFSPVHVKMRGLFLKRDQVPQAALDIVASPSTRLDVELAVDGYGSGTLCILSS